MIIYLNDILKKKLFVNLHIQDNFVIFNLYNTSILYNKEDNYKIYKKNSINFLFSCFIIKF